GMTGGHLSIWDGSTLVDGGNLGGSFLIVYGINEAGQVIGRSSTTDPAGEQRGFFWDGSSMHDLGSLGGQGRRASQPYDVNERGEVVGSSATADGSSRAFHWAAGTMTDLGTLTGERSIARSINDLGQAVGDESVRGDPTSNRALLWSDGVAQPLGTVGGMTSIAFEINDEGWIVGRSENAAGQTRATLWRPAAPSGSIANLSGAVSELEDAAVLDEGQATALTSRLGQVSTQLESERTNVAINLLNAFIRQVQGLVADGVLSEADGRILVDAARRTIDTIT
ncbi:MAG: hypothetical protein R3324_17930, partial [Halobacteriales archaeon]|nr:hypothetical protein [Halobacteriales archaeon]